MRARHYRRRRNLSSGSDESGQAGIELMLVFPIFILIVLVAIEGGLWMYQSVNVANSVREAARFGAVNCETGSCTQSDIQQRAVDRSNGFLALGEVEVGWVARTADAGLRGSSVVVRADHDHGLLFFPSITVPIIACADMRLEQDDAGTIAGSIEC